MASTKEDCVPPYWVVLPPSHDRRRNSSSTKTKKQINSYTLKLLLLSIQFNATLHACIEKGRSQLASNIRACMLHKCIGVGDNIDYLVLH